MERVDPETMAYTFSEHIAGTEANPEEYLQRFLDELFQLEPALRSHFSDLLLGEFKEEIARRDPYDSFATVKLIEDIETDWRNER